MKKKFAKVAAVAVAATMCVAGMGLSACGTKKGENELWITYYKGGYGEEWVKQLARDFEKEHEGVTVRTDPDTQLIDAVGNMMKNGTNYDLIFCHDVTWEDYAGTGDMYCLDDLYDTDVVYNGQTVKFKDRIWDENVLASARYPGKDGKEHYYKVPWTIGTAGIAYNLTVMDKVDAYLASTDGQTYLNSNNGNIKGITNPTERRWNRKAPVDYYDLLQYCMDIEKAAIPVGKTGTVTPFTWSGASEQWQWDYVLFDWWGQLAGPDTVNTFKNFGNVDENFNLDITQQKSPKKEVYDPSKLAVVRNTDGTVDKENSTYIGWGEFRQAYQLWYNLVVGHKNWSSSNTATLTKFNNENAFASGNAAMTPAACWVEYESKSFLDKSHNEISLMPTPTISYVKLDASGNTILPYESKTATTTLDAIHADDGVTDKTIEIGGNVYNRVSFTSSFGDSVMIPAKSTGRDLAVEFILFMQREENAQKFTRLSGGTILPYKYNFEDSFKEGGVDKASAWQKAIFEIDRNSTKFNNYTQHPMMRKTPLKGSARMTSVWPDNKYYYLDAWTSNTSDKYKPATLIKTIYDDSVVSMWNNFLNYIK